MVGEPILIEEIDAQIGCGGVCFYSNSQEIASRNKNSSLISIIILMNNKRDTILQTGGAVKIAWW